MGDELINFTISNRRPQTNVMSLHDGDSASVCVWVGAHFIVEFVSNLMRNKQFGRHRQSLRQHQMRFTLEKAVKTHCHDKMDGLN